MKKILIITYYWPPSGGSGVQRWVKFVKYLSQNNFHCIIYTPENPEMPMIDHSLEKDIPSKNFEILKTKIIEPYHLYRLITGKAGNEKITVSFLEEKKSKQSRIAKLSKWIRGNLFIPDARMLWIKPSIKFLLEYLKKNKVDIIVSTGPPHSMHLIALGIKQNYPDINWIADFRDPWTNIDFLNDLHLTHFAKKKHQNLEKKVLQNADAVITISYQLTNELKQLDTLHPEKFYTITNGFDEDDYLNLNQIKKNDSSSIILTYAGLMPKNRNPQVLWEAIAELKKENLIPSNFQIQLIGKTDASIIETIKKYPLDTYIKKINYLPHSEVIKYETHADALLLIINKAPNSKGILTGKLFEYLALQKPIIGIGPKDGDAAKILHQTNAGLMIEHDDIKSMKEILLKLFKDDLKISSNNEISKYSRKKLTEDLINVINNYI